MKTKYIIYADGFKEYIFDTQEEMMSKMREIQEEEKNYKYKRHWYCKEVQVDDELIDGKFPKKATFVRNKNKKYFDTDCETGDQLTYWGKHRDEEQTKANKRYYMDEEGFVHLVHISELIQREE